MSILGKIRLLLLTVPVVVLASGLAVHWMSLSAPPTVSPTVRVGVCDSLSREFKEQIGRVESQILQGYTGRQAEVFLIRKTVSAQLRKDLGFLNNGTDNALLESIVQKAEDLGSYRNEIVGFLDSKAGPSQTDKAADTYYSKYFPLYEELIKELRVAAAKEPKPAKTTSTSALPAVPWWPWAAGVGLTVVIVLLAANMVAARYHKPALELADAALAGREARGAYVGPHRVLADALNRKRVQEQYTRKVLDHLAAGETETSPEIHLLVPESVEPIQKLYVRIEENRRDFEALNAEKQKLKLQIASLEQAFKKVESDFERKSRELQDTIRDLAAAQKQISEIGAAAEAEKRRLEAAVREAEERVQIQSKTLESARRSWDEERQKWVEQIKRHEEKIAEFEATVRRLDEERQKAVQEAEAKALEILSDLEDRLKAAESKFRFAEEREKEAMLRVAEAAKREKEIEGQLADAELRATEAEVAFRRVEETVSQLKKQLREATAVTVVKEPELDWAAVVETDEKGIITFANAKFVEIAGSVEGKPLSEVLSKIENGIATLTRSNGQTTLVAAEQDLRRTVCIEISGLPTAAPQEAYEPADARMRTLLHENNELKHKLQHLLSEYESLKQGIEEQKQLEYRLVQQQSALQELTRNPDLKTGSVSAALRVVTETAVYTLDEARAGLWLLTDNGDRMNCLDVYDRELMHHTDSVEFLRADSPYLFNNLLHDEILIFDHDTPGDHPLAILRQNHPYLSATTAFMASPIHLTGKVVGMFMVESMQPGRRWHADEQNFLMSAADIISLALEQGNSRAVAEELSATLEQTMAMEEELRQNAEELETTNEEMRRTHIELNGQINALNNAAIVTETNRQGLIMYANAEFLSTYGLQSREVIGQNNKIVSSGEHGEAFWKNMWETILDGRVWKGEIKNRSRSGEYRWMATTITPVFGADGTPFKFISVSFDVTEQKRQEEEAKRALRVALEKERQIQTQTEALTSANTEIRRTQIELIGQIKALDNSSMVYETDMEGAITFANQALLQATGYEWEELKGQRYTILKSGRQPESLYQDQWRTVLNGNVWKGEVELKTRSGEYLWVIMTNTPVLDQNQEPIKSINVLVNITEQKMQELRLKKQQAALMEISNHPAVRDGKKNEAFAFITKIGVETLNVARCSIWFFIENGRKVRCQTTYQKDDYQHQYAPGSELDREMYPTFFKTLELERIIAAGDAVNDPRTKEMAFTLLKPTGVTATIDCAIKQGAKTIGILSLEHRETQRQWTLDEISFVTSLADTVARTIEQKERQNTQKLKQAYAQLEESKKQEEEARQEILAQKLKLEEATDSLRQSIKYAKRIQHSILPSSEVLDKFLGPDKYFIQHKQRDVVGGDFYWFTAHGSKRVIVIADGTGHGVPGAFLTLIGYLLLKQIVNEKMILTPSEILYQLNVGVRTALKQDEEDAKMRDGMDVAVCTFDVDSLVAEYAGANLGFYYYQDWEIHEIKPTKKSIGGEQLEDERHYDNHTIQLKPGDAFYMFTDGFVDQFGGPGTEEKRFSTRRFRELVLRIQHDTMRAQRALINMEWKEWKGDREQLDDVTIFGYKV